MKRTFAVLSLFTSFGTLFCCALPALFVALGFGAAFAGLIATIPQLVWISEYKVSFFSAGAALLLLGGILQWRARRLSCPEGESKESCELTKDWSLPLYFFSIAIYLVGAFFAFGLPLLT